MARDKPTVPAQLLPASWEEPPTGSSPVPGYKPLQIRAQSC